MTELLDPAQVLALARKSGRKLMGHPGPKPVTLQAAIQLQSRVTQALGWKLCGWKAGATSPTAQAILGLDGPYLAPLYAERIFQSGAHVASDASNDRVVEPEIAFLMGTTLPARENTYTTAEVLSAVASVHPALELVSSRLPHGLAEPLEWIVADGGINDALVLGPANPPLAAAEYAAIHVRARLNGAWVSAGMGANVLGGPERVLTWLANRLREQGIALAEGQIVTTGLLTDILRCQRGDDIEADCGALGSVRVCFEA